MMRGRQTYGLVATVAVALLCVGWTDSVRERAARGNRLYFRGKYAQAEKAYGEGIVDHPESDILHFNMAAAQYKQGRYAEALAALEKIKVGEGDPLEAKLAYNRGDAQFQLGKSSEATDPQAALALYARALASFRRAMALDPDDRDAKFNHELVEKRITELKKKLEEERKRQEKEEQEQSGEQNQQDRKDQGRKEETGSQGEQGKGEKQEQAAGEERGAQQKNGAGAAGSAGDREMSADEARALVEAAKGEELDPSDIAGRIAAPVGLGEPVDDW